VEGPSRGGLPPEEGDLAQRLAFLGVTDADRQLLESLVPAFEEYAEEFVDHFYAHLLRFEDTAHFLRDPQVVQRLKAAQLRHFRSMLAARWSETFVRHRREVGQAHARVGVEPRWFLAAYNLYLQCFLEHLASTRGPEVAQFCQLVAALTKAVFIDVGLTMDAYIAGTTDDLRQALDMYWKANTELRHFAELASHDLKTPLATVANLCDEALDEFGHHMPSQARELIEKARQRSFRMSRMIDDLLASTVPARTKGGSEVSSQQIFEEALERVRPMLEQRGIHVRLPHHWPYILGEAAPLCEAFFNLLANAVKFMDKPQGRIEIDVEARPHEVLFAVRDNGPGIPADELVRIFAPFHRLPTHRALPGSGLGLYFTKNVVQQQGGQIWAESTLGEGTCFYVLLPREPSENERSLEVPADTDPARDAPPHGTRSG